MIGLDENVGNEYQAPSSLRVLDAIATAATMGAS